MKKQQGLTLVELMISITLGLVLSAGVISLFISSQQNYRTTANLAYMQENAAFAFKFFERELNIAGLTDGCPVNNVYTSVNLNNATAGLESPLIKNFYTIDGSVSTGGSPQGVEQLADSHVIETTFLDSNGKGWVKNHTPTDGKITLTNEKNYFSTNHILLVTDIQFCEARTFFTIKESVEKTETTDAYITTNESGDGCTLNLYPKLGFDKFNCDNHLTQSTPDRKYPSGSVIHYFTTKTYFIGKNTAGGYSLYETTTRGTIANVKEVIRDVVDMKVKVGIHNNQVSNGYYKLDRYKSVEDMDPPDWNKAIAVEITLTMQSKDKIDNNQKVTKEFSTLISLRNLSVKK